jgi:thioredoxin reductase
MKQDAIVIGGSYAGLSAAMMLARARRAVTVIDAGAPRNRFSPHAHGVLALDGKPGSEILAEARAQLAAYPTVTMMQGEAVEVAGADGTFAVRTADGGVTETRKVLLATGVADPLPDLPGLGERWGRSVLHCPYCHGYEIGGGSIGVLATLPGSLHQAALLADWGDVTLFTNGPLELDAADAAKLDRRRVRIEPGRVEALVGPGTTLTGVRLEDGRTVAVKALFVAAIQRMASPLAAALGCAFDETPLGPIVRTDAWKQTSVPGVFAAGDAASVPANVTLAAADGVRAGVGLHQSLVAGD